ncbi:hypothetical protein B5E77_09260 [Lachnoclostridium sp. An131]|uniref:zinc-dependent alcohol dehydrogenase n=1 Tax=Lachnoclostridium sp. An131 TaxID=1965555 RepID=UPI000B3AC10D|nr:alcohol dehydrogenase catalytic domain-containing protein [Lachnoclostridium sp. An131]OUQ26663.1 hypothetical protein B5E77_09260 [Lachnoclostridium sp. An131]
MKAVRLAGARKMELVEEPEPQICGSGDVKIRVAYSGVCPDEMPFFRRDADMLAWGSVIFPLAGHEMSGTVTEAGDAALKYGFTPGTRVSGYAWKHCGQCDYCRSGKENLCMHLKPSQSTMSEYIVWDMSQLIKLPDTVSFEEAVLTDPIGFSLHGITRANMQLGDNVLIIGGTVPGLILLQLAKMNGANIVTVVDPYLTNRKIAQELGADYCIDPTSENIAFHTLKVTHNLGYNIIFETSGMLDMISIAAMLLAKQGVLAYGCVYGLNKQPPLKLSELFIKEASLIPFHMAPYMLPRTEKIIGKLSLSPLITKIYSMEEATQAYMDCETGRYPHILIRINP